MKRSKRVDVYVEHISNLELDNVEKYRGSLIELVIAKDKDSWKAYLQHAILDYVTLTVKSNGRRNDMKTEQEFEWFYKKVMAQLQRNNNLDKYIRCFASMKDMATAFDLAINH